MPSVILPILSADEIDDLLYLARVNDLHDLRASIEVIAGAQRSSAETIICAAVDPDSGNGLLHMAAANNCIGTAPYSLNSFLRNLKALFVHNIFQTCVAELIASLDILNHLFSSPSTSSSSTNPNLNLPNSSGNTPLHWAALNGHLDAVKLLVNAGAESTVRNNAGHDAVYEAERSGKYEVVEWLLSEGRELESGSTGGGGGTKEDDEEEEEEEQSEKNGGGEGDRERGTSVGEIGNGFEEMKLGKPA
ncbi:MAG: hypothetical protein Q9216_001630 [Gyalolechia sp. 2 TL-2023]